MTTLDPSELLAEHLRAQPPLESWRMPSWDERDGYYAEGTVLPATDVPIYRPPYLHPTPMSVATEERYIRQWVVALAPYYRLRWVSINALHPQKRTKPHEVAWIEKFVDLINRGSDPPPIICDLVTWAMPNGSVRALALRAVGRREVLAWVADHTYTGRDGS